MKRRYVSTIFVAAALALLTACKPESFDSYCSVSGTVIVMGTNEPLQGADVTIMPEQRKTQTGNDGTFYFPNMDASQTVFYIQAMKTGYKANTVHFNSIAGETLTVTIPLEPKDEP